MSKSKSKLQEMRQLIDADRFMLAVFRVFDRLGKKKSNYACSDDWVVLTKLRRQIFESVCREYCLLVDCDPQLFPFSMDTVVSMYLTIRKNAARRSKWRSELNTICGKIEE